MDFSDFIPDKQTIEIKRVCYRPEGPAVRFYFSSEEAISKPVLGDIASRLENYLGCPCSLVRADHPPASKEDKPAKKDPDQARQPAPQAGENQAGGRTGRMNDYYGHPIVVEKTQAQAKKKTGTFSKGRFPKAFYQHKLDLDKIGLETDKGLKKGRVTGLDFHLTKKCLVVTFDLVDGLGGAGACTGFYDQKDLEDFEDNLQDGDWVLVRGNDRYDPVRGEYSFRFTAIRKIQAPKSIDPAKEKRVEFGVHTQMTAMEGVISPQALCQKLQDYGHKAVGIADFASVQAFPEFSLAFAGSGIKPIYGYHAKLLDDDHKILTNHFDLDLDKLEGTYTVFDLETTGLSHFKDQVIEIGAVKIEDGEKVGEFSEFVNPNRPIPPKITKLTSITDSMVRDADPIEKVLPKFLDFCQDSILVGHNADFDVSFIAEASFQEGLDFKPAYLDTLGLARALHPEYKNHKLGTLAKNLQVPSFHHHRAIDDAKATSLIFLRLMEEWGEKGIPLEEINKTPSDFPLARHEDSQVLVYVKNQAGLKPLYRLVSRANIDYFFHSPGLPASLLQEERENLVIMSGFVGSKLFEAVANRVPEAKLQAIFDQIDVVAVQPPAFSAYAEKHRLARDEDHYKETVSKILDLAADYGKPAIAIGMPTYLEVGDRLARNILVNYERYKDFDENNRGLFLNTEEMLDAFSWLGKEEAYKLVVENTQALAKSFGEVTPIPEGTYTPDVEGAEEELTQLVMDQAHAIYGDPLPEIVEARLDRELGSIISNGYASLYVIAERLVKKSNQDGYVVGSRGSVGSSFVAHMAGITEVNPLVPHYVCPKCKHAEFIEDGSYDSGFDLPPKDCPECGTPMKRDGQTIPFEIFLGFDGDKEPDIDLNFAGQYMATIHKYTETLFGEGKVYRAGTISEVKKKTAYGIFRHYQEADYVPLEDRQLSKARTRTLVRTMMGTRRTTGQHAGGLMIVPQSMDILDFCPIQYPADDTSSDVQTTHFSYKYLSGHMLKLDELGHTSPTVLRQLQEMTGINALEVQFDDPATLSIFSSADQLQAKQAYSNEEDGSLGIPEFGTPFVRGMLKETRPKSFAELTRISGLSHGTNVWLGNAQDLIHAGVTDLKGAICTRDDIMTYLIQQGMDKLESFQIMEKVRKGKGIPPDLLPHMEGKVPPWYIESCQKISYMFPKAHAAAYVMMSYRIAWFKVHQPAAFYATAFGQRLPAFETSFLFQSLEECQAKMEIYRDKDRLVREEGMSEDNIDSKYELLELIEEMLARGLAFDPVDLDKSQAKDFGIREDRYILPPFSVLDGVSEANGEAIVQARKEGDFYSRKEFKKRTGLTKSAMESLIDYGLLDGMPASNQMSFFSGF